MRELADVWHCAPKHMTSESGDPGARVCANLEVIARAPVGDKSGPITLRTAELIGVQPRKLETGGSVCLLSLTVGGLFVRARQVTASVEGK